MYRTFMLYNLMLVPATNWSNSFVSVYWEKNPSELDPRAAELGTPAPPQKQLSFHNAAGLSARLSKWAEACREADAASPFPPPMLR